MRYTLMLMLLLVLGSDARADGLEAGAASIDITPPTGHAMWGYASRKDAPSIGVLAPLKARALVLTVGDTSMALVSLDLGRAPTRDSFERIRKKTSAAGVEHLFLVASHTHHGPVLELDDWPSKEKPYVRELETKLARLVVQAFKARQPARLGIIQKDVDANRNRHWRKADPPVDRQLLVLRVEDRAGKAIAHAVNFAAHPTMLDREIHKFTPDFVGALCAAVEAQTEAPCLFLQGAAGDLSPNPPRGKANPEAFGKHLAGLVLELIPKIECKQNDESTLKVAHESFRFKGRLDLSNGIVSGALSLAFYPELIKFYEREYREGVRPCLSVALLDGRIGFVGMSGEVFCGHSLHLKKRAGLEHLFFLGYCNDYQQYFPTIESAAQGGYGTEPYIASAEIGAGEKIMDRALLLLFQMRGRLK